MWNNLTDFQKIVLSKYTLSGESMEEFLERISIENPKLREIFDNKEAIWGGRNLYAIGREGKITGSNCYVAKDPEDTLEDIYRTDYEIARTYSYGGGQGFNISKLRPKNAIVNNTSATSPGPMVFADKFSHTTLNTQQESRRGALMLVMDVGHPDIIDFATAKLDLAKINGANISIAVTDDFMEAYKNDREWVMKFETPYETVEKVVQARDLMEVIAYANHTMGDPGFLMIDTMNSYHLLSEYDEVHFTATNPCGEQPLMANGSCNLASINLFSFVRHPFTDRAYFDYSRFASVVETMVRGLDTLLTMFEHRHALPAQIEHVKEWREIGLGVMGLADLALGLTMSYGSDEFIETLDGIMSAMVNIAFQTSAKNAAEKGSFPKFDYNKISKSRFFNLALNDRTKAYIKQFGLRNSRILSIAPTGSISSLLGVSGGVEPYYNLGYWREVRLEIEPEKVFVWEQTPKLLADHLKVASVDDLPSWAKVTSQNVPINHRLKVQSTIQKYVDTAISSTFNLPNEATIQDIIDIYTKAHKFGLKGATVFRDDCAKMGILSGIDGWQEDKNPATPPVINVMETWRGPYGERKLLNTIQIKPSGKVESNRHTLELCPICGKPLTKKTGCTRCSDPACPYEKCAI